MFWIVGGEVAVQTWLKYSHLRAGNPAQDESSWQMLLHRQLEHAKWEGFRFYDLIFPLFLFIIGVVIPISFQKMRTQGATSKAILWRILKRVLLILAFGLVYNNILSFDSTQIRYAGVLQRLALGYGFAALCVVFLSVRWISLLTAGLLLGYYLLLLLVPPPGGVAGDITMQGNLSAYVDTLILKNAWGGIILKEYYGYGDNEGILSTIPAFATALLGVLAGYWLLSSRLPRQKFLGLLWSGLILLAFGAAWSGFFIDINNLHDRLPVFPIIKNLWTSSYVLWAGGWSLILLALFYGVIDVVGWKAWSWPFAIIGANAITIYLLDHFIDFMPLSKKMFGGFAHLAVSWLHPSAEANVTDQALVLTLTTAILLTGALIIKWLLLWFLYRKKIFLRA
ncbi:MAG TPA: DUF5009 domain-containing protein [Gemmatales bacterium]|nr:DUF5009 domain-containing protein [Gemmatales bacterium]